MRNRNYIFLFGQVGHENKPVVFRYINLLSAKQECILYFFENYVLISLSDLKTHRNFLNFNIDTCKHLPEKSD